MLTITWGIICFQDEQCIHLWIESKGWRHNSLDINYSQKAEECFYWISKQYPQFITDHVIKQNGDIKTSKRFLNILDDLIQPQASLFPLTCKLCLCNFSVFPFFSFLFYPKLLGGSSLRKLKFVCVLKSGLYQPSFVFTMYSTNKIIFKVVLSYSLTSEKSWYYFERVSP